MAPSSSDAGTPALTMRLLVDTKAGRVLYAEANQDVVDFLFSLLTLPIGTVVLILSKDATVSSVGNLYGSAKELDDKTYYARSVYTKGALLAPTPAGGGCSGGGNLFRLPEEHALPKFYRCTNSTYADCQTMLTDVHGTPCQNKSCSGKMTTLMKKTVASTSGKSGLAAAAAEPEGTGFVQSVVMTYTVMDDLKVSPSPMSTISGITMLDTLGITDIGALKEKTVQLGYSEGLELLKASLVSKTVLTDVFLGKVKA